MPRPIALLLVATLAAGCAATPAPTSPMNKHGSTVEHGTQEGPNQAAGLVVVVVGVVALASLLAVAMSPM